MMNDASLLSLELLERLRGELLRSQQFQAPAPLRALFADPRLRPWTNQVPEALTAVDRVDATIALLQTRSSSSGEPALVLLVEALRSRVDPGDAQYLALGALAGEIAAGLSGKLLEPPPPAPLPPAPGESPFKGLHYYDVEDAANFFGREALVATIFKLIDGPETSFKQVAVVGPAGSGKTSLLRAGVVPGLVGRDGWLHYLLTPTANPLQRLATTLTAETESVRMAAILVDDMLEEPRSLGLHMHRSLAQMEAKHIVLLLDHFEELVSLCEDEGTRVAFIDNLVVACQDCPLTLIISVDSEYLPALQRYEPLRQLLIHHAISIGRMTEAELRRAIQEPARREGWDFEPGLVGRIIKDVGHEPGTLPLLSQALHATWERRQGRLLTHAGYQAAGEVEGAVAQTAEDLYYALPQDEQLIARAICLRLVLPRDQGGSHLLPRDTRARVYYTDLFPAAGSREKVEKVTKMLVREHLLVVEGEIVALAQDALLQEWSSLQQWIEDERQALRQHYRLSLDAHHWDESERDESLTYRGRTRERAEIYAAAPLFPLSNLETIFLTESGRAELRQRQRERERQQQTRRSALGAAAGGALAMGLTAWSLYGNLVTDRTLLLFITIVDILLGAITGFALILLVDLALNVHAGQGPRAVWQTYLLAALGGAVALAFLLAGHALFTTQQSLTLSRIVSSIVQGTLWGSTVGLGRAWLQRSVRPLWQKLPLLAVGWALLFLLAHQSGKAFTYLDISPDALVIAVTGALIPLLMLGGAEIATMPFMRSQPTSAQGSQ